MPFLSQDISIQMINWALYDTFLKNHLSKKKIKKVYFFNHENLSQKIISNHISNDCYEEKKDKLFIILAQHSV